VEVWGSSPHEPTILHPINTRDFNDSPEFLRRFHGPTALFLHYSGAFQASQYQTTRPAALLLHHSSPQFQRAVPADHSVESVTNEFVAAFKRSLKRLRSIFGRAAANLGVDDYGSRQKA
jgi:hypothetical protein